ncbi:MAG: decarboxylating 6-phosphogluconate dehydrogenase [bacterium]
MQIAIIGLGRMGINMGRRFLAGGHEVVAYNRTKEKTKQLAKEGAIPAYALEEIIKKLKRPRVVWLMLPAGKVTQEYADKFLKLLKRGDILIEGGNSYYKDDIKRETIFKAKGIKYMDVGVSGGIWGLKKGYSTMVGGDKKTFDLIAPLIKTLAPKNGYMYCGPTGAGHFVKMVHNGIEYALMEAYGEGFEILKASPYGRHMKLGKVAAMWNNGSVVRSWLLELLEDAFKKDSDMKKISGYVEDSGEARWTAKQAIDSGVAADVITAALYKRFNSRQKDAFSNKVVAALRNEFGGHALVKTGSKIKKSSAGAGILSHAKAAKNAKARG